MTFHVNRGDHLQWPHGILTFIAEEGLPELERPLHRKVLAAPVDCTVTAHMGAGAERGIGIMEAYFVLDEHGEPQQERDLDKWERWFENADRKIARTSVSREVTVLTTFRGVDEIAVPGAAPKLFETRVFGGVLDGEEVSHCTKAEAIAAHSGLAQLCRIGIAPDLGVNEQMIA